MSSDDSQKEYTDGENSNEKKKKKKIKYKKFKKVRVF